ncbi:MAG: chemotaxis protein CheW [Campylobacterales bacterium]|nr:chemotaxis protein CheW [Campylobacterales bacterium]
MSALSQVLVVSLNDSKYGIETDDIEHILRVPEITNVPLSPKVLRGICSLEGGIVTVYDGKNLIDKENDPVDVENYKSRMLTIRNQESLFSILVDEVVDNITPDPNTIEDTDSEGDDPIVSLIKTEDEIIQVLSIEKLTKEVSIPKYELTNVKEITSVDSTEGNNFDTHINRYLLFKMGDESYALDIESIREIIFKPEDITPIADSPNELMGMFTLRENVLISIDLRTVFDMKNEFDEKNRIIIIQSGENSLGLLVDAILDIRDVEKKDIDKIPEHFNDEKLSGVAKVNNELISIIDDKVLEDLLENSKSTIDSSKNNYQEKEEEKEKTNMKEVVIFTLQGKEYAFSIDNVEEIIRFTEITPIPESPEYLNGIINLRGEIIPIISLHYKMSLEEEIDEDTKILVCKIYDKKVGFLVDSVTEVSEISSDNIQENDSEEALFSNVILLDAGKRIILEMATDAIFEEEEIKLLTKATEGN